MKNLNEIKDLINLELIGNGCETVHEIRVSDPSDNLFTLIMCSYSIGLETLKVISNWSGDPNPMVFQAHSSHYPFEVMVEWFNEDIPF